MDNLGLHQIASSASNIGFLFDLIYGSLVLVCAIQLKLRIIRRGPSWTVIWGRESV